MEAFGLMNSSGVTRGTLRNLVEEKLVPCVPGLENAGARDGRKRG